MAAGGVGKRHYRKVQLPTDEEEAELISTKLEGYTAEKIPGVWLRTGNPLLDEVMGAPGRGIPYGKVIKVSGWESGGKSALVLELAAMAQKDSAEVGWVDAERCYDEVWVRKRGVDPEKVKLFKPKAVETKGGLRLEYAEETFDRAEKWVMGIVRKDPYTKIFLAVDSLPAITPRDEIEGGLEQNAMAANARFLKKLLNRWTAIADSFNIMLLLINQLRLSPAVRFGNPEYEPGGSVLKFCTSINVRVKRSRKGGKLLLGGRQIGIRGTITNTKNKAGGLEGSQVGYKLYFDKPTVFLPAKEVEEEGE